MKSKVALGVCLAIVSSTSVALESFIGKVLTVEPTYLPDMMYFVMDTGNATCPAGTWLKWQKADQGNNKAVYATLMSALISDKQVRFFFNDGDLTCIGQYLHLLK